MFDDSVKVGTYIALLHSCPRRCMPNPVEGLLEVYEDIEEVLLVLEIFITKDFQVEDLLCGSPSCSEACLLYSDDSLRLRLQSVQYDLQYDFAWVACEADFSVVLALLQVAFLGTCDDYGEADLSVVLALLQVAFLGKCDDDGEADLSVVLALLQVAFLGKCNDDGEADLLVVLALLQVAFLGKCDNEGLGSGDWPLFCPPHLVADSHESSDYFFSTRLDQFSWDVVNSG